MTTTFKVRPEEFGSIPTDILYMATDFQGQPLSKELAEAFPTNVSCVKQGLAKTKDKAMGNGHSIIFRMRPSLRTIDLILWKPDVGPEEFDSHIETKESVTLVGTNPAYIFNTPIKSTHGRDDVSLQERRIARSLVSLRSFVAGLRLDEISVSLPPMVTKEVAEKYLFGMPRLTVNLHFR